MITEKIKNKETMMSECYNCVHKINIPGDCHIGCNNPDINMTGDIHGIKKGWFCYPLNFDPVWKTKLCNNYTKETTERTYGHDRHR